MHTPLRQSEHLTDHYVAHDRSFGIDISSASSSSALPTYHVRVTEQGAEVVMGELGLVVAPSPEDALSRARGLLEELIRFELTCSAFLSYVGAYETFVETREDSEFDALKAAHSTFTGLTPPSEASAQLTKVLAAIFVQREQQTGPVNIQKELVEAAQHFRSLGAWISDEGQRFPRTFWTLVARAGPGACRLEQLQADALRVPPAA